jgi:epoxyqueuosine reductase
MSCEKFVCSLRPVWCLRFGIVRSAKSVPKNPKVVAVDAPGGDAYWHTLHALGLDGGLDALGVAKAEVLSRARAHIEARIENDLVNTMKFTFLRPERSTNPTLLVEGARSVIVGARSYAYASQDDDEPGERQSHLRAHIARYAWDDHYGHLKASLNVVASQLRRDGHRATVFADDNSIVDREVAYLAGLGWFGRNANILIPGKGSMFVLGCIVTTADLPVASVVADGCGTCMRCVPACPTGAIVDAGVIDAHRCLSWLLQKPGVFAREHRIALGARIYGCDDCQTVCPPTKKGGVVQAVSSLNTTVDVLGWLSMGDSALNQACEGWYVDQRDMTWVRRNLLIVLGNVGNPHDVAVVETLRRYLSHDSGILRAHATWAAARVGLKSFLFFDDPDKMVQDELADLPPLRDDL